MAPKNTEHTFGLHAFLSVAAIIAVWVLVLSSSYFSSFIPSLSSFNLNPLQAQAGVSGNVSGYAWSDTIGWISFNCSDLGTCGTSNYSVNLDSVTGNLSGYAWSDNIGWISFNATDVAGCPSGTCQPRLSGGSVLGWAKALSAGDGWDGFISLSCSNDSTCGTSNYGATLAGSDFGGHAWGSDVVGWISFNCTTGGPTANNICGSSNYKVSLGAVTQPSITSFSASPIQVTSGNAATLSWTTSNASSCTASGGWSGSKATSGSASTGALSVDTSFTLTCTNAIGSANANAIVTIYIPPDFSITSTNNLKKSSVQVDSSTTTIKVVPVNSFTNTVTLSASPATLGGTYVSYVFSRPTLTSAQFSTGSILNVTSTTTIPNGRYTITVSATDGSLTRTTNIILDLSSTSRRIEEI